MRSARAFSRLFVVGVAFASGVASLCCGLADHDGALADRNVTGGAGVGGDSRGGQANPSDAHGGLGGAPGELGGRENAEPVAIGGSDCASRPLSDCENVLTFYESNAGFEQTPAFAQCDAFNSFDGCGVLEFSFDADGCASSVSPGARPWKNSLHLIRLQECLTDALGRARYPCLATSQLRYEESCFVR